MAGQGFNSPQILFLNTWDQPERDYLHPIFTKLTKAGYTRFVEPCAGAFVMPTVAQQAGWKTANMETSDVCLFSALLGHVFMDQPLDDLEITIDGNPLSKTVNPDLPIVRQVAETLYWQLRLRMAKRPEIPYWDGVREDLQVRQEAHTVDIMALVKKLDERLHGITYYSRDVWAHIESVADDPHTVISINPPTYKGGFEKFYETDNRLEWKEPSYEVFDAETDVFKLMDMMRDRDALILCQQQQTPENAASTPVYGRHLSPDQYVYICTNKPTEVLEWAGGLKVKPRPASKVAKLDIPVIDPNLDISETSKVEVMTVGAAEASHYRDLWTHKLAYKKAPYNVAVVVDGKMSGLIGYEITPIIRPYPGAKRSAGHVLLVYAIGAPHKDRLTRLVTQVSLTRTVIEAVLSPQLSNLVEGVMTVEMTKHPEAKGLRGLMKLEERKKDKIYGYKLIYMCPVDEDPLENVVPDWLRKEKKWQKARAQSSR